MKQIVAGIPALLFLFLGIVTLDSYGINWDSAQHFNRGQAYARFLLARKTNYNDLPRHQKLKGGSDFANLKNDPLNGANVSRVSYYQSDYFDYNYFIEHDSGHPPASDILSAVTNEILYIKIGVLPDIEAYNFYIVFVSFLLVFFVSWLVYEHFGLLPSLVSSSTLALYPLFWSESHFNIKDPPLSAFVGIAIICFYQSITQKKFKWLVASAISCGLAFGTKLNSLFFLPALLFWAFFYLKAHKFKNYRKIAFEILFFITLSGTIFLLFWPYLWQSPLQRLFEIVFYYKDIGTAVPAEIARYNLGPLNTFALEWIISTTPIPILILSAFGLVYSIKNLHKKNYLFLLIFLWFLVPILRVSIKGAAIYGGVRQIMEFVPAMAVLTGIGAWVLVSKFPAKKHSLYLLLILSFGFIFLKLVHLHPNENIYTNIIASEDLPYLGNSFGNAYAQGVNWLNKNAEKDAKLSLIFGNMVNVPRPRLRSDIDFSNTHFSGPLQKGEYIMEMTNNGVPTKIYAFSYAEKFLEPVFVVKADNLVLLKVWKNDPEHLKVIASRENVKPLKVDILGNYINVDIGKTVNIEKLKIVFSKQNQCIEDFSGIVSISTDKINWSRMSETLDTQVLGDSITENTNNQFSYLLPGENARYVSIEVFSINSCLLNLADMEIITLVQ